MKKRSKSWEWKWSQGKKKVFSLSGLIYLIHSFPIQSFIFLFLINLSISSIQLEQHSILSLLAILLIILSNSSKFNKKMSSTRSGRQYKGGVLVERKTRDRSPSRSFRKEDRYVLFYLYFIIITLSMFSCKLIGLNYFYYHFFYLFIITFIVILSFKNNSTKNLPSFIDRNAEVMVPKPQLSSSSSSSPPLLLH